ncbi:hypothetical protein FHT86_007698 [Rhizobium sp. BK313]|nr:hypothetical protein [Rhizobium sp. BK313]MBB3459366.1 hypothetical protein [Rhizobium sp. BK313]
MLWFGASADFSYGPILGSGRSDVTSVRVTPLVSITRQCIDRRR